jgi:hypothetical protein
MDLLGISKYFDKQDNGLPSLLIYGIIYHAGIRGEPIPIK